MSELKSFRTYRFKNNSEEELFHEKFSNQFTDFQILDLIVFGQAPGFGINSNDYLTEREQRIVLSTIQWLGSPVGQGFLEDCGYKKDIKDNNER